MRVIATMIHAAGGGRADETLVTNHPCLQRHPFLTMYYSRDTAVVVMPDTLQSLIPWFQLCQCDVRLTGHLFNDS